MQWSSVLSQDRDPTQAAYAAASACRAEMGGERPDLALLFLSPEMAIHVERVVADLQTTLAARRLLGCSAGGVIGGGREIEQGAALALMAARLPGVTTTPVVLESADVPDADAGPRVWTEALGVPVRPRPHFIVLADPFTFPAPHLLPGLDFAYPASVKLGGLASGAREPGRNFLLVDGEMRQSGLVGVALAGALHVETIVAQGCRPIGPVLRVTRSRGHLLLGLDDRPALETVHRVLEELDSRDRVLARNSLHVGLHMDPLRGEPKRGDFLIRNLTGIDPGSGAILVGDELREGQNVQLHVRDAASSRQDLELLLDRYVQEPRPQPPRGVLLFSCLGRGRHLYGEPHHDSRLVRAKLGAVPLGGFFCNGEIGPVAGATHLHGFTSSLGLFAPATIPDSESTSAAISAAWAGSPARRFPDPGRRRRGGRPRGRDRTPD